MHPLGLGLRAGGGGGWGVLGGFCGFWGVGVRFRVRGLGSFGWFCGFWVGGLGDWGIWVWGALAFWGLGSKGHKPESLRFRLRFRV